jgi:hypothetical protein
MRKENSKHLRYVYEGQEYFDHRTIELVLDKSKSQTHRIIKSYHIKPIIYQNRFLYPIRECCEMFESELNFKNIRDVIAPNKIGVLF